MTDATLGSALAHALAYARRGWYVFPVEPGTKKSHKSAKYSGGMKWGNTRDEEEIQKNFAQWPNAGVGVMTGPESGIFVVDVDSPEGHVYNGIANFEELQDRHGTVPQTLMAKSPTGGYHYFFKYPQNAKIKNSSSQLAPGIDIKGMGGIVLVAPTPKYKDGNLIGKYEWLNNNPIAEAPQWLLSALAVLSEQRISRSDSMLARTSVEVGQVKAMLEVIPNEDRSWDDWNRIAMTIFHVTSGSEEGLNLLKDWSAKSEKYSESYTELRWREIRGSPPRDLTVATLIFEANKADPTWRKDRAITIDEFYAFMSDKTFIWSANGMKWLAKGVDAQLPPVMLKDEEGQPILNAEGQPVKVKASEWLARNKRIHTMTWAPGEGAVIQDKVITETGWQERPGARIYNMYKPALRVRGNASKAGRWLELVDILIGEHREHFLNWVAYKVQYPGRKINHALVLGGTQGIGKDTLLNPIQDIIGDNNFANATPATIVDKFSAHAKAVILRINEARDLGDINRFQFYEHMKTIIAAPPEVIQVNQKYMQPYNIPNVVSVIFTTNHKHNGLYLPPDDRRHFVIWSEVTKEDFPDGYFQETWDWFDVEGYTSVAAFLHERDVSRFNPYAPPKLTEAFYTMVEGGLSEEDMELADVLDRMKNPDVVTQGMLKEATFDVPSLNEWLSNPRTAKLLPHKMENIGYVKVRNRDARDGYWKIAGKRSVAYVKNTLSPRDAEIAIKALQARMEVATMNGGGLRVVGEAEGDPNRPRM